MGILYLLIGAAGLIFCLRNFYAAPSLFNIRTTQAFLLLFAATAAHSMWSWNQIRKSGAVYYPLAAEPAGPHEVVLPRLAAAPGWRGRLVFRQDRRSAGPPLSRFAACRWSLTDSEGKALQAGSPFSEDELFEVETDHAPIRLRYEAGAETRALLESVELEVSLPRRFWEGLLIGEYILRMLLVSSLGAMFLAAAGIAVQRRRMRKQGFGTPRPSTTQE